MDLKHLEIYLQYAYYAEQSLAEQSRMINYVNLQMNSKKKLKPTDLYKFPWETKNDKPTTQADRQRLINEAKRFEKEITAHGNNE